ncbi:MAG TPA: hypothetical protein PKZ21_02155 [Bacteroidales bacterium]|nr:hypothetical protein [Bacteroidales bacterium]HPS45946.1 hypothetical protein [Bacteroidales bacterium]
MNKLILFTLSFLSFYSNTYSQEESCCKSIINMNKVDLYRIKKLGKAYQHLSEKKDSCCEQFESDLHKIMETLCFKINQPGKDTTIIYKVLGKPDAFAVPPQYGQFTSGNEKIMIYWWRSWRDFVYIISENGIIKYSKFFYSYE